MRTMIRQLALGFVSGVVLAFVSAAPTTAHAGAPGSMLFAAEDVELKGDWEAKLKKANLKSLEKKDGEWKLFVVAFLKKSPGAGEVSILFYDTAEKNQTDPNAVMPVSLPATAKILATSLSFNEEAGVKPGHTYNVVVARKVGGKDEIYAKAQLALK
jgi:hypothetical protein